MSANKNNTFPYREGVNFGNKDNQFDETIPKPGQKELSLILEWIGQQALRFSPVAEKDNYPDTDFIEVTKEEEDYANRKRFIQVLNVQPNTLRFSSTFKLFINWLIILIGILAEFFIYQMIGENSFGMSLMKSYFVGGLVVAFTKFLSFALHSRVKYWIKEKNLFKKSFIKVVSLCLVVLILINAVTLGVVNLDQIARLNKIQQLEYLSSSIYEAEENGEDVAEMKIEESQLLADLNKEDSAFITIVKFLAIALISLLTISTGAILYVYAELSSSALKLKKENKLLNSKLGKYRASLPNSINAYNELISLHQELVTLFAQKSYLERLLSSPEKK